MRAGDPKKYEGLLITYEANWLLTHNPEIFASYCNGVGSKEGFLSTLLWHIVPNFIWGLDITPASDIHDVNYSYPLNFNTKKEAEDYKKIADEHFYINLKRLIYRDNSTWGILVREWRLIRAHSYYLAVSDLGNNSFFTNKYIGE